MMTTTKIAQEIRRRLKIKSVVYQPAMDETVDGEWQFRFKGIDYCLQDCEPDAGRNTFILYWEDPKEKDSFFQVAGDLDHCIAHLKRGGWERG